MDKGREAIKNLVALIRQSPANYESAVNKTIEYLRSHGWRHETDVVEGKMVADKLCVCKKTEDHDCDNEKSIQLQIDCNDYDDDCFSLRPATIADLLKP
jgi:hypothetical protein